MTFPLIDINKIADLFSACGPIGEKGLPTSNEAKGFLGIFETVASAKQMQACAEVLACISPSTLSVNNNTGLLCGESHPMLCQARLPTTNGDLSVKNRLAEGFCDPDVEVPDPIEMEYLFKGQSMLADGDLVKLWEFLKDQIAFSTGSAKLFGPDDIDSKSPINPVSVKLRLEIVARLLNAVLKIANNEESSRVVAELNKYLKSIGEQLPRPITLERVYDWLPNTLSASLKAPTEKFKIAIGVHLLQEKLKGKVADNLSALTIDLYNFLSDPSASQRADVLKAALIIFLDTGSLQTNLKVLKVFKESLDAATKSFLADNLESFAKDLKKAINIIDQAWFEKVLTFSGNTAFPPSFKEWQVQVIKFVTQDAEAMNKEQLFKDLLDFYTRNRLSPSLVDAELAKFVKVLKSHFSNQADRIAEFEKMLNLPAEADQNALSNYAQAAQAIDAFFPDHTSRMNLFAEEADKLENGKKVLAFVYDRLFDSFGLADAAAAYFYTAEIFEVEKSYDTYYTGQTDQAQFSDLIVKHLDVNAKALELLALKLVLASEYPDLGDHELTMIALLRSDREWILKEARIDFNGDSFWGESDDALKALAETEKMVAEALTDVSLTGLGPTQTANLVFKGGALENIWTTNRLADFDGTSDPDLRNRHIATHVISEWINRNKNSLTFPYVNADGRFYPATRFEVKDAEPFIEAMTNYHPEQTANTFRLTEILGLGVLGVAGATVTADGLYALIQGETETPVLGADPQAAAISGSATAFMALGYGVCQLVIDEPFEHEWHLPWKQLLCGVAASAAGAVAAWGVSRALEPSPDSKKNNGRTFVFPTGAGEGTETLRIDR
jgi:hypothetical protein